MPKFTTILKAAFPALLAVAAYDQLGKPFLDKLRTR